MSTLIFVVAFCIVAVFVYMARYSGRLRVTRTRIINAPLADVFARVADFGRWQEWNPWLEHDPEARVDLLGPAGQKGSSCSWDSARLGAGMIETTGMVAGQLIEQRMRFRNPFRFRGRGLWLFADRAGKTEVTWSMNGRVAFSLRAFAQTVRGMIDLDFRYGLDRLARLIEPEEAPHYSLVYLGVREIAASRYGYRTYEGSLKGLGAAMREGFADLRQQFAGQGILAAGDPIAVYIRTNVKLQTTLCRMGIPIGEAAVDNLPTTEMPSHRAYVVRLQGGYAAMEVAWYHAMHRMRIENIRPDPRMPPFERYLNDPDTTPENDYLTELHIPVRQTP